MKVVKHESSDVGRAEEVGQFWVQVAFLLKFS